MSAVSRIVAAYKKQANQPPGARQRARSNALPINKPKGIDKTIQKENGVQSLDGEESVKPQKRDILPKDVFTATPKNTGVVNLAQTGNDLTKAIKQVKKDKGHDVVYNLSQYLIRTEGV